MNDDQARARLLPALAQMMQEVITDDTVQAWEASHGDDSTRLARCLLLHSVLRHMQVECCIVRTMFREGARSGDKTTWDVAYAVQLTEGQLRLGPLGEVGDVALAQAVDPNYTVLSSRWGIVPQQKLDEDAAFLDLDARTPPAVALLQALLLDNAPPSPALATRPRL